MLDLGDLDRTVDITSDGKTIFNEGISCDLKGFEVYFYHHGGGRLIP